MKVLYVTDVFPPRCGGSGWSVYFFARALRSRGHEVRIVSLDGGDRVFDGFAVRGLPLSRSRLPLLANINRENRDLPAIAGRLKEAAADCEVLHAHHKWSFLALSAAAPGRALLTVRDYWPVCICGRSEFRSGTVCSRADFTRCSRSESLWKGMAASFVYPWFETRMKRRLEAMAGSPYIFCISNHLRGQLLPFFPRDQLAVLPNFAEEVEGTTAAPPPTPSGLPDRFLLYVGRLEHNKGVDLLPGILEASDVPLPLVLIGEGSLQARLERDFRSRGLAAHFLGYRPYAEMLAVMKQCEFVLFPSIWAEPLGRVLIEAAMMQKAAVAFGHPGGHLDIVLHGETGLLADAPDAFSRMIAELASSTDLRTRLGNAARARYLQEFSEAAVMPRLLDIYLRCTLPT